MGFLRPLITVTFQLPTYNYELLKEEFTDKLVPSVKVNGENCYGKVVVIK